ncbi:hypothetical protein AB1Y20_012109 [Prymnesium parvum]|uniref:TIR domain-containing protein n=1 Tax=Prymnesium parvum TaxID=97485 RepID=A0AB34IR51_PRYPA
MGACCSQSAAAADDETHLSANEVLLVGPPRQQAESCDCERFQCFLAHDWGLDEESRSNHERVSRVKKLLDERGVRAWFDEEQLRGDINGQMADGIDRSHAVVVFITRRYMIKVSGKGPNGMNDNCKFEFDYALRRKGVERMIPVVMERCCLDTSSWRGAVGGKLGGTLYVNLTSDEGLETGVDHLVREVLAVSRRKPRPPRGQSDSGAAASPHGSPTPSAAPSRHASLSNAEDEWTPRGAAAGKSGALVLASVPAEVAELPDTMLERPQLVDLLTTRLLDLSAASKRPPDAHDLKSGQQSHATVLEGIGGVGKSVLLASLARDIKLRAAFKRICCVSVGQSPDLLGVQSSLHRQLALKPLPDRCASDVNLALEALRIAARGTRTLLLLDDVWDKAHVGLLSFIDAHSHGSALLVATRIRGLLPGAVEVVCPTLSDADALALLLGAADVPHLLSSPPAAALEVVELCDRLPLALEVAGGMIRELADSWEEELPPLLRYELSLPAFEQRIVGASMNLVDPACREGAEALLCTLAAFPAATTIPTSVIDAVASLAVSQSGADLSASAPPPLHRNTSGRLRGISCRAAAADGGARRLVRRWLLQLLRVSLLRGSIEAGIAAHGLAHDLFALRADTPAGALHTTQRAVAALLLDAFDALPDDAPPPSARLSLSAPSPASPAPPAARRALSEASAGGGAALAGYVCSTLHHHLAAALDEPALAHAERLADDALWMRAACHAHDAIRAEAAAAVGGGAVERAARRCEREGRWREAAELMYTASVEAEGGGAAQLQRAARACRRVDPPTAASRALEARVLGALLRGGSLADDTERQSLAERISELSEPSSTADRS